MVLCLSVLTSISNSASLFSGLASFMTCRRAFLAPGFMLLVETWPPPLKPLSLVHQHWLQTEDLAPGPVHSAWLCSRFLAKSRLQLPPQARGSFLFLPFKESLTESTQNSLVHFCAIGMSLLMLFFSFSVSLTAKRCIFYLYSYIFNWISPYFFPLI